MKKRFTLLLIIFLVLGLITGAFANEQIDIYDQNKNMVKSVVFKVGTNQYFVDNKVPGIKMDAAPYIAQDRTFVPIRFLANALGVDNENISWNNTTSTAKLTLGTITAELTVGKKQIITNGQAKAIDVAPKLNNNRTFLPARFVAEALGYQVDFINGLVVCYPKGTEKPDVSAVGQYLGQEQQPTQDTYVLNGYTVPNNPVVLVEDDKGNNVEISIGIIIPKSNLESQFKEAEQILASKLGTDFAKKVVDTARQKTEIKKQLYADFTGPNGESISIASGWGDTTIGINVWSAKGGN